MTHPSDSRSRLASLADGISLVAVRLSEIGIVAMTILLTYEVLARYFFRNPTHWTSDIATTVMIWMTFIAMGYCLREGHMIRITAIVGQLAPAGRKAAEMLSLVAVLLVSVFAVWITAEAMMHSINYGMRQPTMLRMSSWIAELPVVIGFAILALQALADLLRLPSRPAPVFVGAVEQEFNELQELDETEKRQ